MRTLSVGWASGKCGWGLAAGIAATLLSLGLFAVLRLERAELASFDVRLRWRVGNRLRDTDVRVLIAAIDRKTIDSVGGRRWPMPRDRYAELVRFTRAAGARCLGFDLRFEEPRGAEDRQFAAAMRAAGHTYLGVAFERAANPFDPAGEIGDALDAARLTTTPADAAAVRLQMKGAWLPPAVLREAARGLGSVTVLPEIDGVVRRFPLVVVYVRPGDPPDQARCYASLPLLMAADLLGVPLEKVRVRLGEAVIIGDRRVPIDDNGEMVINYYGPYRSLHHLSYADIVAGAYEPRYFRDRAVLVGNTHSGGFDTKTTPYGGDYPGVEVQAAALQNILDQSTIRRLPEWVGLLVTFAVALLVGQTRRRGLRSQIAVAVALALGVWLVGFWLIAAHFVWLEVVRPLLAIFLAWLAVSVSSFLEEQAARARVQGAVDALAEMTQAVSHPQSPAELRARREDGIRRVLGAQQATLHIEDAWLGEWLPGHPRAAAPSAGEARAPMLLHGKEVGYVAVGQMPRDNSPALVSAVTAFATMALESAVTFEESRDRFFNLTMMLADIIESNDRYTAGHCARVMKYACAIGARLALSSDELEDLRYAALLHDVGKAVLDKTILNKPAALTEAEQAEVRQHPVLGRRWLQRHRRLRGIADLVGTHHERWDGGGYPDGLAGEQIPLGGRILAAADVWDALTTDRPYRPALSFDQARAYIANGAGTQFDPVVVTAFLSYLDTLA
ncbi:MAG: CHASE2 domain-containing protein [Armatimonadetes bacterium]|nr:CHASE2 domain-containing protein [Armatimonadota bacterium]